MRERGFLPAQIIVSLICAEQLSAHPSPYPPPCGRPLPDGKGDDTGLALCTMFFFIDQ